MTQSPQQPTSQPAQPPHYPPAGGSDERPTSSMALWAMILGIAAVATSCVGIGAALGLASLIMGVIAMGKTGDPPYPFKGKGMAITGLVLGILSFVLLPVFALMIGILLPALGAARRTAQQLQNSTQLQGIHQSFVTYAQSNKAGGTDGWYPGLDPQGDPVDVSVEYRFEELLNGNYITPEYLINRADNNAFAWDGYSTFDSSNYSYALLDISEPGSRRQEWSETLNTMAVILADRNTGSNQQPASVWTDTPGDWRGTMTRNDNSTAFETTHLVDTQYDTGPMNYGDDLFDATGTDDALMIHEGE